MTRCKLLPRILLGCLSVLFALQGGCANRPVEPAVAAGVDGCSYCNMVIDITNQACGYVLAGQFVPFDSPECLLRSYEALRAKRGKLPAAIYFADYHSSAFHHADSTVFLLTGHVSTVMNGRVICFGDPEQAREFSKHDDEELVDWTGYLIKRGIPDRRENIRIGQQGMQPETIELNKDELVELRLRAEGLEQDMILVIRGYEELGEIRVPASGEEVFCRFRALRPGAGFPLVNTANNVPVGMIKVAGAHTMDEQEEQRQR